MWIFDRIFKRGNKREFTDEDRERARCAREKAALEKRELELKKKAMALRHAELDALKEQLDRQRLDAEIADLRDRLSPDDEPDDDFEEEERDPEEEIASKVLDYLLPPKRAAESEQQDESEQAIRLDQQQESPKKGSLVASKPMISDQTIRELISVIPPPKLAGFRLMPTSLQARALRAQLPSLPTETIERALRILNEST